jgi:hypothetical protein
MATLISMVHATSTVIPVVESAAATNLPGVDRVHILDEGILRDLSRRGELTPDICGRFIDLVKLAYGPCPDIIFLTCSSFSELIPWARRAFSVPILGPDEAMVEEVAAKWSHIGIVASVPPAISSARNQLKEEAKRIGRDVTIRPILVEQAFLARKQGDLALHDQLLVDAVLSNIRGLDGIMLCQFTMAHLTCVLEEKTEIQVISSLDSAFRRVRELLGLMP